MVDLPKKKVGIIACSGEELSEGTVTRLAALKVLEQLRPQDTVTICLPLFLAGGEGDRAFAKFYPTIAIDGCEKRCAYHGTERYSNQPAASLVVSELLDESGLPRPRGCRKLDEAGAQAVDLLAELAAQQVDELLGHAWNRRAGSFEESKQAAMPVQDETVATCSCGSGIPIQKVMVDGREMTLVALPLIMQNYWEAHSVADEKTSDELLNTVKVYNRIEPEDEDSVRKAIQREYMAFCQKREN